MPGPAIHHLVADRLRANIQAGHGLGPAMTNQDYAALQALLADRKNLPYLFVGCHGPDPFFFNTKDLSPVIGTFVGLYFDLQDFLADVEKRVLDAIPDPILDALAGFAEAANEVIEDSALLSEIKQLFESLNAVLDGLLKVLTEGAKKFITDLNVFDLVSHPYRDGAGEGEWWWFDAMHYRRTGKFTAAMLEATRDRKSPIHLYALGYLTHVAADTVGHAYVNLWSGGPYRSQGQRHKTGENYQDVQILKLERNLDFNRSKLHELYNFDFAGTGTPPDRPVMPADLAQFIADTLNRIYQEDADADPDYAKRITAGEVDDTYRLWFRFMRGFTETGTLPPPKPYSLTAELEEVWDKAMDNLGEAGDILEDAVDQASGGGLLSIFLALVLAIIGAVVAAIAIIDAILGALATLGTATIRYAASLIYEQLYNAFQNFRLGVALNGLGFPMLEHLADPRLAQFITPTRPDPAGATAATILGQQPLLRFETSFFNNPLGTVFHQERHLVYPLTDGERNAVQAAPGSYLTTLATHPAFGRIPLDGKLLEDLVTLQSRPAPAQEQELTALLKDRTLGNAITLTEAMYDRWNRKLAMPDFNLDADRGYGYLCWTQSGDAAHQPKPLRTNTPAQPAASVSLTILP